jgi:23S rRNA (cytidine1920-2'-O)/16S rRNA (cytidine1409-2'-O)-methyltransferase
VGGEVVPLIKPQFEAGRQEASRGGGVIREARVHRRVLADVLGFAAGAGFQVKGLLRSPLLGPKGNAEFLAWLALGVAVPGAEPELDALIDAALAQAAGP